jgi:hypothetical protein
MVGDFCVRVPAGLRRLADADVGDSNRGTEVECLMGVERRVGARRVRGAMRSWRRGLGGVHDTLDAVRRPPNGVRRDLLRERRDSQFAGTKSTNEH